MTALADSAVPRLLRGVRVHWDAVRGTHVLLAPERVVRLDAVGHAVLSRLDGRCFGALVADLAATYAAPAAQIGADAGRFLTTLIERRMVEVDP